MLKFEITKKMTVKYAIEVYADSNGVQFVINDICIAHLSKMNHLRVYGDSLEKLGIEADVAVARLNGGFEYLPIG